MRTLIFAAIFLVAGCSRPSSDTSTSTSIESPYIGQESRTVKSLSEQEIDDYLNGRGLGFAMVAELNHYPGPRHVLDALDQMNLDGDQTRKVQTLFDVMNAEAIELGKEIVTKETELDTHFAENRASESEVEKLISEIGTLTARLRFVHVRTHLDMKSILTPEQVERYDMLRGYGSGTAGHVHQEGMTHGS